MDNQKSWCMYKHTFPNGKVYIGVTGQAPEARWENGFGYKQNKKMLSDILYYGWRNVAHEILYSDIDERTAKAMERSLIMAYGDEARRKTYNTAYTFAEEAEVDPWLKLPVTAETLKEYGTRFVMLDDYWLETYIQQMGTYPFGTKITEAGVEITFYIWTFVEPITVSQKVLLLRYPKNGMTFREVHAWLYTAPDAEIISESVFLAPSGVREEMEKLNSQNVDFEGAKRFFEGKTTT